MMLEHLYKYDLLVCLLIRDCLLRFFLIVASLLLDLFLILLDFQSFQRL